MTVEAFETYDRHLKTDGAIEVHISNRWLDLELALAVVDHTPPADQWWLRRSIWALLTRNESLLDDPAIRAAGRRVWTGSAKVPLWTDDYSSLVQMLRKN